MKKRELLVFAGQSNMMGAGAYPPRAEIRAKDSWEYLYRNAHLGAGKGSFRPAGYPCGEFLYRDAAAAYPDGRADRPSPLAEYAKNTYFAPSMSNLKNENGHETWPFSVFSEANFTPAPALPPILAEEWERLGHVCAYTHAAKGSTSILHYFDDDMVREYAEAIAGKSGGGVPPGLTHEANDMTHGASACFRRKCEAFFRESAERFPDDDTSVRCLLWLQGESDKTMKTAEYRTLLEVFWRRLRQIGFTHFLCVRVGFFGDRRVVNIMKAQEEFCAAAPDAFIVTRACSLMPLAGQPPEWYTRAPEEEYLNCRDSFFGFPNQHINEKGFRVIARRSAENMERILTRHELPVPEEETVRDLCEPDAANP